MKPDIHAFVLMHSLYKTPSKETKDKKPYIFEKINRGCLQIILCVLLRLKNTSLTVKDLLFLLL